MAGTTSLEAVKRKIKFLQEQADGAEERSERLQKELLAEKTAREQVSIFFFYRASSQTDRSCLSNKNCASFYASSSCSLSLCYVPSVREAA